MTTHIGMIGAGAWGSALTCAWASETRVVTLMALNADLAAAINGATLSSVPGFSFPGHVRATPLTDHIDGSFDLLVYALPAQTLREFLGTHTLPKGVPFLIAAKGIESETGMLLSQVATEKMSDLIPLALSGPNFASEVARGLPAASTLACPNETVLSRVMDMLQTPRLRLYQTSDIIGAQAGGSLKNVIAIACGICDGLYMGDNARAALMTRGLAEITRAAVAMGAMRETLMGLSGMGDLILTCGSTQSRNYRYGALLAKTNGAQRETSETTEGIATARAAMVLAQKYGLDLPICTAVAAIIDGKLSPQDAVTALLDRPSRGKENL